MSSTTLYRLSGGALLIGGGLFSLFMFISAVLFPGELPPPGQLIGSPWLLVNLMLLLGAFLGLIGLPGIYLRQARQSGWSGLIGFVMLFAAVLLIGVFYQLYAVLVLPWLATVAPLLVHANSRLSFAVFLIGGLLFTVGSLLFGMATFRARLLPRGAALVVIIGAVLSPLTTVPVPDGLAILSTLIGVVSAVLLALGFGWFGLALWLERQGRPVTTEQAFTKTTAGELK